MPTAQRRKGSRHKFGGRNNGPSRQHYWSSGRLEEHKVEALMRHNRLTRGEAYSLWHRTRRTRMKGLASD